LIVDTQPEVKKTSYSNLFFELMLLGCNQEDKGAQVPFTHWLCVDDKGITQNPHKSLFENKMKCTKLQPKITLTN
jgi:hypothetical protein